MRILPAERAKPGLGPTIRVCQGQGTAPCVMVSQWTHVPPQSWGCHLSPEASPGAQISIQELEEQDSEAKKVLESQEQCSMRRARSSPKGETPQFREAAGPAHSLGHLLSLHWRSTGRHGLIFGHPWRPQDQRSARVLETRLGLALREVRVLSNLAPLPGVSSPQS